MEVWQDTTGVTHIHVLGSTGNGEFSLCGIAFDEGMTGTKMPVKTPITCPNCINDVRAIKAIRPVIKSK